MCSPIHNILVAHRNNKVVRLTESLVLGDLPSAFDFVLISIESCLWPRPNGWRKYTRGNCISHTPPSVAGLFLFICPKEPTSAMPLIQLQLCVNVVFTCICFLLGG